MLPHLQEGPILLTGHPAFSHPHPFLFIELMSNGGQIHRSEILTLQQVVEAVLGAKRALLLKKMKRFGY